MLSRELSNKLFRRQLNFTNTRDDEVTSGLACFKVLSGGPVSLDFLNILSDLLMVKG